MDTGFCYYDNLGIKTWVYHCTKNEFFHSEFLQWMWPHPQFPADLVSFTEELLNGKCTTGQCTSGQVTEAKVNYSLTFITFQFRQYFLQIRNLNLADTGWIVQILWKIWSILLNC